MSKYYFYHIPKTGGTAFKESLNSIGFNSTEIKNNKIKNKFHLIDGHFALDPIITHPNIISFTILRNPVTRLISHFAVLEDLYFIHNETNSQKLDFFESWILDAENMLIKSNFQTRFLSKQLISNSKNYKICDFFDIEYFDSLNSVQKNRLQQLLGWGINHSEIDFNLALATLNNMAIVGTTENHFSFIKEAVSMFNNNDNLELNISALKDIKHNTSSLSEYINKNLNNTIKEKIIELNNYDFILWEEALKRQKIHI